MEQANPLTENARESEVVQIQGQGEGRGCLAVRSCELDGAFSPASEQAVMGLFL
jgi:hypothetical protein